MYLLYELATPLRFFSFSKFQQDYAATHPDKALTTKLVMAQLYLTQGHVYEACESLKSLGDLRYKPGVVGQN